MNFLADPRHRAWALAALLWTVNVPVLLAPALVTGAVTLLAAITVLTMLSSGWLVCAGLYEWIRSQAQKPMSRYVAAVVLGVIASAILLGVIDGTVGVLLYESGLAPVRPMSYVLIRAVTNTIFLGWMCSIYAGVIVLFDFQGRIRQREDDLALAEIHAANARAAATAARLAALRYQLNPHFLFNTLNAVSSAVVAKRTDDAEAMLARLASFLRQTLSSDPTAFIRLEDELGTVESYLEIEAERFRDRLSTRIVCPQPLLHAEVPSFILQPLIENAIKHGVSRSRNRVLITVEISAQRDELQIAVTDDARPLASSLPAPSSGIGHTAIRERLEVLYGAQGRLDAESLEQGFRVVLKLPLKLEQAG